MTPGQESALRCDECGAFAGPAEWLLADPDLPDYCVGGQGRPSHPRAAWKKVVLFDASYAESLEQQLSERDEQIAGLREALAEDPAKWSFHTLVAIARLLLDTNYPTDIFGDGPDTIRPDSDPGVKFLNHLRAALRCLSTDQPSDSKP